MTAISTSAIRFGRRESNLSRHDPSATLRLSPRSELLIYEIPHWLLKLVTLRSFGAILDFPNMATLGVRLAPSKNRNGML